MSLTYDAARREVTRHGGGRAEVVGDDVFAALEAEIDAGTPDDHWFGYLGYACRPDLPAATGGGLPDGVWMRAPHVRLFDHPVLGVVSRQALRAFLNHRVSVVEARLRRNRLETSTPPEYAAGFDVVQEHLHAGNSYEVNLTYRLDDRQRPGSRVGVPAAARRSTPRRTPDSSSTTCPATAPGC